MSAAAVVLAAAGGALARPGKVVVVERRSARAPEIGACLERSPKNLICFAGEIERADELHVLSEQADYERVVISSIRPSRFDSCKLGALHDARVEILERMAGKRGRQANRFGMKLALKNVHAVPGRARILPRDATRNPERGADVMFVVDLDGSGRPELILTNRDCPESRRTEPGLSGKNVRRSTCVSFWQRSSDSSQWRRIRREVVHECR